MHGETHKELARKVNQQLTDRFPEEPLEDGSIYPDRSQDEKRKLREKHGFEVDKIYRDETNSWAESHHRLDYGSSSWHEKLLQLLYDARREWLSDRAERAGFLFGVFTHFASDYAVRHELEKRANFSTAPVVESPSLSSRTDARNAVMRIGDIKEKQRFHEKLSSQTIKGLYKCVLRAAFAVAEQASPDYFQRRLQSLLMNYEDELRDLQADVSNVNSIIDQEKQNLKEQVIRDSQEFLKDERQWGEEAKERIAGVSGANRLPSAGGVNNRFRRRVQRRVEQYSGEINECYQRYKKKLSKAEWFDQAQDDWYEMNPQEWQSSLAALRRKTVNTQEELAEERVKRVEPKLQEGVEKLRKQCIRVSVQRFPDYWKETRRYKMVIQGYDNIISVALPVLSVLMFLVALGVGSALVGMASGLGIVLSFVWLYKVYIWRKCTDYVEE